MTAPTVPRFSVKKAGSSHTMLGFLSSDHEVGLYNTALKIKSVAVAASTALTSVLVPRVAYYFSNRNSKGIIDVLAFSIKISLLFSVPLCVFCFIFGTPIIGALSGEEYLAATKPLHVLMFCSLALILTYLCGAQILIPMGQEKRYSQSVTIGLFINIVLNCILIPLYGAWGAALGTLITESWNVLWMGIGCVSILKKTIIKVHFYLYLFPLLFSSVLSVCIYPIFNSLNYIYIVVLSAAVYFGTYYLILFVLKENIMWSIIKKYIRVKE